MQLGAWGWGSEALPDSPQLWGGSYSLLKGPSQPLLRLFSNSFGSLGHNGLFGHFNLPHLNWWTLQQTQAQTEACGRLAVSVIVLESMASLAGGTWTYARWERTWQVDTLGSMVDLEAWSGAWSFFYWLMSCPRHHRYIKGNQKKKNVPSTSGKKKWFISFLTWV